VVGVRLVPVDQRQVARGDVRLAGERRRRIQDALPAGGGAEGEDAEPLRQVMTVGGVHPEDVLGGVGVAGGDRTSVDGQALWVIPGRAVETLQTLVGAHLS